jgi:RNA polymerase sigma-70 factor (ECF subfamily)
MQNTEYSTSDIFKKYSADILKYSFSLLKNSDDAKDAVQEVFIRYISSRDNFRGECSEKTWLLTITRNYCFKLLTKNKHARTDNIDEFPQLYDPKPDITITLKDAIDNLSPEDYELVYLREYAGYTYQEISQILEISTDNVKIRLFRVRQKLKQYLSR